MKEIYSVRFIGLSAFFLLDQDNNSNLLLFPVKRLLNNNALFVDALVALVVVLLAR